MEYIFTDRQATLHDRNWIWALYAELLRKSIEKQWGWDESWQIEYFHSELPVTGFHIVCSNNSKLGAYFVRHNEDHIYLKMLLVAKPYQACGVGKYVVSTLQRKASIEEKELRLSVIKSNPVSGFYTKLGFECVGEQDGSVKFVWFPSL